MFARFKNIFLFLIIFALLGGGYYFFLRGESGDSLLTKTATEGTRPVEQELITLLLQLRSIRLDEGIFASPVFDSLNDFSQPLQAEPVGRPNPFAPLGQ